MHKMCNSSSELQINFELGSWLEKNNRLYEQGAARNLSLKRKK